jgi:phenylacetate-CoA ligase
MMRIYSLRPLSALKLSAYLAKRAVSSPRRLANYRSLLRAERMSRDEVACLNWERRRALVRHAYEHNAFYRRKFDDAGIDPNDLRDPADFARLPILEKEEIRANRIAMITSGYSESRLRVATTGGTTGHPLKTHLDPGAPGVELSWRTLRWWDVGAWDNAGYLYRAVPTGGARIVQRIALWPTRRAWISPLDMGEEELDRFYLRLRALRPAYLMGYVGAVDVFADFLSRRGLRLPGVRSVWTTAAPLPPAKRLHLQRIFDAPVYTQYGSCEFYWIAAECRHQNGLHIANDVRHVEVVSDGAPVPTGSHGDVLVTDLLNYGFPLIRYRIGDRGRLLGNRCSCSLPFPMMDYVRGRISDTIRLPGGRAIPGEYWTTIFDNHTAMIKSFQIHQAADYAVRIFFEPFPGVNAESVIAEVRDHLAVKLGPDVPLAFVESAIDVNTNGKTRFVVSDVPRADRD